MKALWAHGSVADGTVVGYSDADLVMIVDIRTPDDARGLRRRTIEANRAIRRFQPDQHHGIQIIPSIMTADLPEQMMPAQVSRSLRVIVNQNPPTELVLSGEGAQEVNSMAEAIRDARRPRSSYEAMKLLSQVMLLPALEQRALGKELSKRDALAEWAASGGARQEAVSRASSAREAWPEPSPDVWSGLVRTPLNPWMVSAIRRRVRRVPRDIEHFVNSESLEIYRRAASSVIEELAT